MCNDSTSASSGISMSQTSQTDVWATHHLGVEGIGANLFAVIIPAALPLARGLAANELLRMISGRLKDLLTVRAMAITHQAAPDQNASRSFCLELRKLNRAHKKFTAYRNSCRVFYRVPADGAAAHQTGVDIGKAPPRPNSIVA